MSEIPHRCPVIPSPLFVSDYIRNPIKKKKPKRNLRLDNLVLAVEHLCCHTVTPQRRHDLFLVSHNPSESFVIPIMCIISSSVDARAATEHTPTA